ncbi:TlpA family protein disulfide reductase [Lutibacter sp.]|uniref:TlpA family protein disulfide reductase n=1 Tax=Lutibacter sp. TaxID=1925666 RepID=UPI003563A450
MKKLFTKNRISNIIFIIALAVLLYPPSREWFMRQIAFSPSINNDSTLVIEDYNWNLQGLNTEDVNFTEFKDKVIFVNFWATWCPPCRAEMPMIQKLYNDYKDKVVFIFVTTENWPTVESFFIKNNYNLPTYNSISNPPEYFTKTNSIPATYVIDSKGTIVIDKVGSADWNGKKVRELLDNKIQESK